MANHLVADNLVVKIEGVYSNDPNDTGGETIFAIARNKHPNAAIFQYLDTLKKTPGWRDGLANDPYLKKMAIVFRKQQFWDVLRLDEVRTQYIATELYDTAINMGVGVAATFLQRVLNVANKNGLYYLDLGKPDGVVGKNTLAAVNAHPRQDIILRALNALQGAKYISICEANPSQEKYFNGWMTRVFEYDLSTLQ